MSTLFYLHYIDIYRLDDGGRQVSEGRFFTPFSEHTVPFEVIDELYAWFEKFRARTGIYRLGLDGVNTYYQPVWAIEHYEPTPRRRYVTVRAGQG